jgi:hypothetical protein
VTGRPGRAAGAGRELYIFAQSLDRVAKERAIRRRQLKRLWARLKQLWTMLLRRKDLLMKLGAARNQSRKAWRVVVVEVARSQRHVQLLPISQEATASAIARRQGTPVQ